MFKSATSPRHGVISARKSPLSLLPPSRCPSVLSSALPASAIAHRCLLRRLKSRATATLPRSPPWPSCSPHTSPPSSPPSSTPLMSPSQPSFSPQLRSVLGRRQGAGRGVQTRARSARCDCRPLHLLLRLHRRAAHHRAARRRADRRRADRHRPTATVPTAAVPTATVVVPPSCLLLQSPPPPSPPPASLLHLSLTSHPRSTSA